MGYIKIFGETLDSMLSRFGLTDDERATVVSYVKDIVVESYKNGIEQGKREGRGQQTSAPRRKPTRTTER